MAFQKVAAPASKSDQRPLYMLAIPSMAATLLFVALRLGSKLGFGDPAALDRALLLALRDPANPAVAIGPSWLRKSMVEITSLGGGTNLTLFVIIAAGVLIVRRAVCAAMLLVMATATGGMAVAFLKERFAHSRPTLVEHFVEVQSTSFPSAHSANSAIVFLTLGTLLYRFETGRAERIYAFSVAILLTILIGVSRVYLGVHWPSDVAAGWMLGSAWACLWCVLATVLPRDAIGHDPERSSHN